MKETDKEFVERVALDVQVRGDIYGFDRPRLVTLARCGADAANEIERLKAELLERDAVWLPEKDAEIGRLRAALRYALENGTTAVYGGDDDECGTYSCCGEVSYKPHENDCWTVKARAALKEDGE